MSSSDEEILAGIDSTLDQLIDNAEVLHDHKSLFEYEIDALQKTQESLLSHLLNLEKRLHGESKKSKKSAEIYEKLSRYSRLNSRLIRRVTHRFSPAPKRSKANQKCASLRSASSKSLA